MSSTFHTVLILSYQAIIKSMNEHVKSDFWFNNVSKHHLQIYDTVRKLPY
jgi:hypothetical protein